VQAAINRHQPFAMVEWSVNALRQAGVKSINLDLVYGLPRQTTDGLIDTVDRILALESDRLALFGYAHVPWMMPRQKLIKEHELPSAIERFVQQSAAAREIEDAGYVRIGLDHFALPEDSLAIAARNRTLRRNFQGYSCDRATTLIGFGASSISSLDQGFAQNHPDIRNWRENINAGRLAVARGVKLTDDDRFCSEIIQSLMCNLEVDLDLACRGRGAFWLIDKLESFRPMEFDGLVTIRGSVVRVTEAGRPFLRAVCAAFDQYLSAPASIPRHSRMI
jgi:oxygen-independent coproporphyrinogen-3 oxidase